MLRCIWLPCVAIDAKPLLNQRLNDGGAWLDRENQPLRLFADGNGDFFCFAPLASHSPNILNAVLTAEDRSFYEHSGFDPVAIGRAAFQNFSSMKIISGASTITQQLIRILKPRPRTVSTKISEIFAAMRLETESTKSEILENYLNTVPMFGNIRGFYLASLLLFRKTPDLLTLAESATLAAMIQSPGRLSPFDRVGNKRLRRRRDWIIREMLKRKLCQRDQAKAAFSENIPEYRSQLPFKAPHFCDLITSLRGRPTGNQVTTISQPLQDMLQKTLASHLPRIAKSGARQICGMIVGAEKMEILALVGSAEFGPIAAGFNNGCVARRSGGSILKPFLYALAFEQGYYPSYVLADTMQPFKTPQGEYLPYNADRRDYGPVTIRNALGNSLNISAVKMLNLVGIKKFFNLLVELGLLTPFSDAAKFYGLGLAIGNPELRMLDLVKAYGIFANDGSLKSLSFLMNDKVVEKSLIDDANAYLIYDILSDPSARLLTFGTPSFFKFKTRWALKTGTSTHYRDCWLVAFNKKYLLAIWVGNFDGSPTRALSGSSACGPVAKDLISNLEADDTGSVIVAPSRIQKVKVCSFSGQRPGPNCRLTGYDLVNGSENDLAECEFHQFASLVHELPADYARWIQSRSRVNDADPFRLLGNLIQSDAWSLLGVGQSSSSIVDASGPITISDMLPVSGGANIKIVSPHEGDRYLLSSGNENYLKLRAIPDVPIEEIVWLIDGREFIRTPPPYEAYWPMIAGRHRITAMGHGEFAAEVAILVER